MKKNHKGKKVFEMNLSSLDCNGRCCSSTTSKTTKPVIYEVESHGSLQAELGAAPVTTLRVVAESNIISMLKYKIVNIRTDRFLTEWCCPFGDESTEEWGGSDAASCQGCA